MNPDEKNKHFDGQLRKKFEDFSPGVPTGLWDKIASQLDAQEQRHTVPMNVKQRRFPTWWTAVAAALLIVCGVTYWYNRPITTTYLQGHVAPDITPVEPTAVVIETAEPTPLPVPLDVERLKRVFAKKNRKAASNSPQRSALEEQVAKRPTESSEFPQLAANDEVPPAKRIVEKAEVAAGEPPIVQPSVMEEALAGVPDIQPLVTLEDEDETMLASTAPAKQPFGLSNILNYVVGTVDQREEKLVTFSNDDEGSLKLDFNFSLAKNKKKKLK